MRNGGGRGWAAAGTATNDDGKLGGGRYDVTTAGWTVSGIDGDGGLGGGRYGDSRLGGDRQERYGNGELGGGR